MMTDLRRRLDEALSSDLRDWMEDNGWSYDQEGWLVHPDLPQRLSPDGKKRMGSVPCDRVPDVDFCSLHEMEVLERWIPIHPRLLAFASERVQLEAVRQYGAAIHYIRDPSEAVQLAAVRQDGYAIGHIKNPSEAVQLAAVRQDGFAIRFIRNPSEAVQLAAVQQDGFAIEYIRDPSEEVRLAAVQQNTRAIKYIGNPSEAVRRAARR